MISRVGLLRAVVVVAAVGAAAACTDTQTKTVEVPTFVRFNAPPDSNYLGFFDDTSSTATCGNCHAGQQADWSQTIHDSAWADLVNSGVPNTAPCEGCHTVNGSHGNTPVGTVPPAWTAAKWGWDSVKSVRYHNVQCESCHGPGHFQPTPGDNSKAHVVNPTIVANRPLASMHIDTAAATLNGSCGSCHTDAPGGAKHHNYLREWKSSRHGNIRSGSPTSPTGTCQKCHEGRGALRINFGVQTNYREINSAVPEANNCVVCHDPHGSAKGADGKPLPGQLRFPLNSADLSVNLCTHCHNRRSEENDTSASPHGAQGPVLFGTAGYFPPGTIYDQTEILATHGSAANPRLCAGCHVNVLNGKDPQGNTVKFSGHTFHPVPCMTSKVDSLIDTSFTNDCAYDVANRSYLACAQGCHGSEAVAANRLLTAVTEFKGYLDVIFVDKDNNGQLNAYPADTGYLAKLKADTVTKAFPPWIPAGYVCDHLDSLRHCGSGYWQLNDSVNSRGSIVITSAKGARFNARLTGDRLTKYGNLADPEAPITAGGREDLLGGHPDGSHGVHNPFLYRALLQSSIADLIAHYGGAGGVLPAPPALVVSRIQGAVQSGKLRLSPMLTQAVMNPQVVYRK